MRTRLQKLHSAGSTSVKTAKRLKVDGEDDGGAKPRDVQRERQRERRRQVRAAERAELAQAKIAAKIARDEVELARALADPECGHQCRARLLATAAPTETAPTNAPTPPTTSLPSAAPSTPPPTHQASAYSCTAWPRHDGHTFPDDDPRCTVPPDNGMLEWYEPTVRPGTIHDHLAVHA